MPGPAAPARAADDARVYAGSIVETVREPLIVLAEDLRVVSANRSFYRQFRVSRSETEGRLIFALGNRQWDMHGLREALAAIISRNISFNDLPIEHDFPAIGRRTMLLNGRRIDQEGGRRKLILLAIEDITERLAAESRLRTVEQDLLEQKEMLEGFFLNSPVTLAIFEAGMRLVKIDRDTARTFFGTDPGRLIGRSFRDIAPQAAAAVDTYFRKVIENGETVRGDFSFIDYHGRPHYIVSSGFPLQFAGGRRGAGCVAVDITRRKEMEEALRESEGKYRTLVERANDGIVIIQEGIIKYANPCMAALAGSPVQQLVGSAYTDHIHPPELPRITEFYRRRLAGETVQSSYETVFRRRDGSVMPVELNAAVIPYRGKPADMLIIRDITERREAEERIRYISFHDEVTGLFNRAFFEEELRRIDTERELPVSIIMGDVNNLKLTNDVLGHREGDVLLQVIAGAIRTACRKNDIVARWGGDEFAVILPRTDAPTAREVRARILQITRGSRSTVFRPSIALGVATKEQAGENIYQIVRRAEEKMYDNKLAESARNERDVVESLQQQVRARMRDLDAHLARSRRLARRFGAALGFREEQMQTLLQLIELHDIGMAVVPAAVLGRRGCLPDREWEMVKKHPGAGYAVAKTFPDTAKIADEILAHAERWDGSGYPRGLRGREIPYLARVFGIIEAFDAMTHARVGRRSCRPPEALERLQAAAGRQFDPELVEVFVGVLVPGEKVTA